MTRPLVEELFAASLRDSLKHAFICVYSSIDLKSFSTYKRIIIERIMVGCA